MEGKKTYIYKIIHIQHNIFTYLPAIIDINDDRDRRTSTGAAILKDDEHDKNRTTNTTTDLKNKPAIVVIRNSVTMMKKGKSCGWNRKQ